MIGFIDDHRAVHGVEPICKVLPIAPSTYHAHWCTFGLADAKLRSGGASANPSPCRDGQRRLPLDGPHETRRAAGAGRPRRTTG